MEYTVLARRFRPQAFSELVGQGHIAQALSNAIAAGRVAHAYLFTGARGVGKTSSARILAKALNCPNAVDGVPCNKCEVCEAISTGSDVDVLEIDGASNRGVDEVRTLRANVGVRSMRSRYKIYIIDEVHMLTKEAFNALLKTLEEPPPSVKFIFCTTDPQKLPDTILSRCQRFDFGTIATTEIAKRLKEIADAEGVEVEPAAIELVARRAAGSMRDSQSLFDQLLAFGGKKIDAKAVHRLLGTAPDERVIDLVTAVIERRRGDALKLFDEALGEGVQLGEFTDQLVSYLRDLMVLASGAKEVPLLSISEDRRATLQQQAQAWGLQTVLAAMQVMADAKLKMRGVTYGRPLAEMALVRISLLEDLDSISQLIQGLKSAKGSAPATRAMPAERRVLPSSSSAATAITTPAERGRDGHSEAAQEPATTLASAVQTSALPAATQAVVDALRSPVQMSSTEPADAPADEADTAKQSVVQIPFEPGNESAILAQIISSVTDAQLSQIRGARGLAILGPNQLGVLFPKKYNVAVRLLERPELLNRLEKIVEQIVGRSITVRLKIEESGPASPVTQPTSRQSPIPREIQEDPIVMKLVELFGAQIVTPIEAAPIDVPSTEVTSSEAVGVESAELESEGQVPETDAEG